MTAAEATQAVAIIARHLGAVVVEFNPGDFSGAADVQGAYMTEPGETPQLAFPTGQDPTERARAAGMIARKLVAA